MDLVAEVANLTNLADHFAKLASRASALEDHATATSLHKQSEAALHLADFTRAIARQTLSVPTSDEQGA